MERPESPHVEYLREKEKIDNLYDEGYQISNVVENIDGAFLDFSRKKDGKIEGEKLHILNPDTRKYFSNLIIADQKAAK